MLSQHVVDALFEFAEASLAEQEMKRRNKEAQKACEGSKEAEKSVKRQGSGKA